MNKKNLFPGTSSVKVNNTEKVGLPQFMVSVVKLLNPPNKWLPDMEYGYMGQEYAMKKIAEIGSEFFSNIETNYEALLKRQDFVKWFFSNKDFIDFLLTTTIPLKANNRSGNRYAEIDDVLLLRSYTSNLLRYLLDHPYSATFAKKMQKDLYHLTQIDRLMSACDSINMKGTLCYHTTDYSDRYHFDTKNLELRLVGKNNMYILPIIDYFEGRSSLRGSSLDSDGGTRNMPYPLYIAIIEKIFSLYYNEISALTENKEGKVYFKLEISNFTPKSIQCKLVVEGFNAKYTLYPVRVKATDYSSETIKFNICDEKTNPRKYRISTDISTIKSIIEIPGREFANKSNGFINKLASTVYRFLKSDFLSELILLASIANYYKKCCKLFTFPVILPKEEMTIKSNISLNPLFTRSKTSVPNNISLNGKVSGFVIYGANTGGKTSYANMIVLNQIFAQTGLPIFAENSNIAIKDNIFLHYKEGNEISPNSSIFDAELTRLKVLLKKVSQYSLVVFDEAFTGTDVKAGTKQLKNVIQVLNELGCHFIMTTHFHTLIHFVDKLGNVENLHFTLPDLNGTKALNYKLQPGGSNKSFGSEVALRKGLDLKSMRKLAKLK